MSRDKSEVECAGRSQVMLSQKKTIDTSWHYDKKTGDLWHLECWEAFRAWFDFPDPSC
jgi:hypothetical protein